MKRRNRTASLLGGFPSGASLGGKVSHYRGKENIYKQGFPCRGYTFQIVNCSWAEGVSKFCAIGIGIPDGTGRPDVISARPDFSVGSAIHDITYLVTVHFWTAICG